jgi:hypothetical protein
MLVRGETTEERIAKIAQGFGQGIQNFQQGQNQKLAQANQAEATRRQQAIDAQNMVNGEEDRAMRREQLGISKDIAKAKMIEAGLPFEQTKEYQKFVAQENVRAKNRAPVSTSESKIAQKQMEKLGTSNAGLFNVKGAMDEALKILRDPTVGEDQKIKVGQGLYKSLNSAEGADAVGAEEAKRLGSYLEYNIANFTQPGAFIGRDLKGFTGQIENYAKLLGGRIQQNESGINTLRSGGSLGGAPVSQSVKTQAAAPVQITQQHVNTVKSMSDADLIKFVEGG